MKKIKNLNKLKKVVNKICDKIVRLIKKMYDNFMTIPLNIRKVIYIWCAVVLVIILLVGFSSANTSFLNKYKDMENVMNVSALDYVESNKLYPVKDNKLKIDLNLLKDYNYIYSSDITDKSCEGFSVVYYNDIKKEYVINSYINCDNYTTKGYSDYLK